MRTSLALVSLVPLLAACQSSLGTADAGSTTPTDVVTVADTPVVTDGHLSLRNEGYSAL